MLVWAFWWVPRVPGWLEQKEAQQNMRPPSQPDSMDTDESKCLDLWFCVDLRFIFFPGIVYNTLLFFIISALYNTLYNFD